MSDLEADFAAFLAGLRRCEPGQVLPPGFVHPGARWLVKGQEYLGRVSLRHSLNERLREFGGHVGYEARPWARRQGYGRLILRLALQAGTRAGPGKGTGDL